MKVICAGVAKTGVKTMNAALTMLGYEVHDFMENYYYAGDDWVRAIRDGAKVKELRRMYGDVDAACDFPIFQFWEELHEAFSDAKIILTVRDEDSWYRSAKNQCARLSTDIGYKLLLTITYSGWKLLAFQNAAFAFMGNRGTWPWSTIHMYNEEAARRWFRRHNRDVIQSQLLVFDVRQGWGPLCEFLSKEVPADDFPHKNRGAEVLELLRKENVIMRRLQNELYASLVVLMLGLLDWQRLRFTRFDDLTVDHATLLHI